MIAILGATGYIGRSLARALAEEPGRPLALFARDPARLATEIWPRDVALRALDTFAADEFELVVNAIGAGDPARVASLGAGILDVTQAFDQRVLATMGPRTRYVFLSSGAVYGAFTSPVHEGSAISLPVNRLGAVPPYTIAKLYAEARHRHAPDRAILDLRVFAYADRAIALDGRFFLAELARSVARREPFATLPGDMVRDYAGVDELAALIRAWEGSGAPNGAADLYTRAPVGKLELLAEVQRRFGLDVRFDTAEAVVASPTAAKPLYVSHHRVAAAYGYEPRRTALEVVVDMLDQLAAAEPASAVA